MRKVKEEPLEVPSNVGYVNAKKQHAGPVAPGRVREVIVTALTSWYIFINKWRKKHKEEGGYAADASRQGNAR